MLQQSSLTFDITLAEGTTAAELTQDEAFAAALSSSIAAGLSETGAAVAAEDVETNISPVRRISPRDAPNQDNPGNYAT